MFKNTFQSGFLSILYSLGSKPLQIWDKEVVNGHVKRPQDEDIQSNVLEIVGSNVQSTYITCPADPAATLGIKLPFLVMIVKNLKQYFTFEIQVLDDKNVRRRFRASNFQVCKSSLFPVLAVTRVKPFICTMPLRMDEGWNQIQLNLADFTRRAYGTNYVETLRVQVHANCRLRRIYFADRLYSEEELPPEFKLYLPMQVLTAHLFNYYHFCISILTLLISQVLCAPIAETMMLLWNSLNLFGRSVGVFVVTIDRIV
ncbi:hypothetical protein RHMOL_Rhmol07G0082400 [Rhododendron molle]|uniref:Uncharacterized protein n=2 Tax=Rhododendron molle TaxID=49168 RepID=A0ACC0MYB5_RHOML|nr:hypothetical protein RHMOL_Rhmol07G0082400 [Rhododendron molle]KAI8546012.1 hypothetical protein RHMOL_Rhmol07G0082400 [Rhododendron molle]